MFDANCSLFIYPKRVKTVVVFVQLFMSYTFVVPDHNRSSQNENCQKTFCIIL